MASSTVEDYLKAILHLQEKSGTTTVGEVAAELEVTPGTVTTMMRHLSEEGFVDYAPRKNLQLLPKGKLNALKVVRRHRLIELFLVQVMKLDWSEVHEEAEILEHVISDRLLDRIDAMLGEPLHDPHGHPIPDREGNLPAKEGVELTSAREGRHRIVRVSDEDSSLLAWLDEKGISIGMSVAVSNSDRAAGVVEITTDEGVAIPMGSGVAGSIYVEAVPSVG